MEINKIAPHITKREPVNFLLNPDAKPKPANREPMLSNGSGQAVQSVISHVFDYEPSPLVSQTGIAASLDVGALQVKDEGARLGLKSFKALGGAYAVIKIAAKAAAEAAGGGVELKDLPRSGSGSLAPAAGHADHGASTAFREAASRLTFACATDGNHGQSVAAGARLVGAKAIVFVHEGVTQSRRDAIARFGAEIRVVRGNYDDAVEEALRQAEVHGWTLLSDTTWPGYMDVPKWVMQGYTLITHELVDQLAEPPTHVFLQAGVGGFAAAIAVSMAAAYPDTVPRFIVVEPSRAACLMESARNGRSVRIRAGDATLMSMLECYEPSLLAWNLLSPLVTAFLTVDEGDAIRAMKMLAFPPAGGEPIVAGESGAAGLAGLLVATSDPRIRAALDLTPNARVLVVNTESATDESRYAELVGVPAARILLPGN